MAAQRLIRIKRLRKIQESSASDSVERHLVKLGKRLPSPRVQYVDGCCEIALMFFLLQLIGSPRIPDQKVVLGCYCIPGLLLLLLAWRSRIWRTRFARIFEPLVLLGVPIGIALFTVGKPLDHPIGSFLSDEITLILAPTYAGGSISASLPHIFSQAIRNNRHNTISPMPRRNIAGSQIARFIYAPS